uniref:DUF393 domain-containing protein n=1 Tax=Lotharella oceanica TaxID=641309 RepID=A0A7S2U431_9EUKA
MAHRFRFRTLRQGGSRCLSEIPPHEERRLLIFDGLCVICNTGARFVLERDRQRSIFFAQAQSEKTKPILRKYGISDEDIMRRVAFIDAGEVYRGAAAAVQVAKYLKFPWWPLHYGGLLVPSLILEPLYDVVAKRRYQLLGKYDSCKIPTEAERKQFIDFD